MIRRFNLHTAWYCLPDVHQIYPRFRGVAYFKATTASLPFWEAG